MLIKLTIVDSGGMSKAVEVLDMEWDMETTD
jgi:hypothetical protein